jgi:class 3 adenylate cyclase
VRDQIRDKLSYKLEDRGEHEMKNIARPVRVFSVRLETRRVARPVGTRASTPLALPDTPSIAVLPFDNMSGDPSNWREPRRRHRSRNDFYSDGVNMAARLEGLADPGGICVARSVRDQIRDRLPVQLEDRGRSDR